MKNNLRRIFTLPNIVIIISALYICFQVYELPAKVNSMQERLALVEKDNVMLKTQIQLLLNAVYETRADIKQMMKDIK